MQYVSSVHTLKTFSIKLYNMDYEEADYRAACKEHEIRYILDLDREEDLPLKHGSSTRFLRDRELGVRGTDRRFMRQAKIEICQHYEHWPDETFAEKISSRGQDRLFYQTKHFPMRIRL